MKTIKIHTEFIKLDSFLKFAGICSTGGEAKIFIMEGSVLVNGVPCLQRGKKLVNDDVVALKNGGEAVTVCTTAL